MSKLPVDDPATEEVTAEILGRAVEIELQYIGETW
jgi:hypothetical protein